MGGEAPKDNAERLALAQRAYDTRRFALAARLWAEAIESDPTIAADRNNPYNYNAACAAALAADGKGRDALAADDPARDALRKNALPWLRTELVIWTKLLDGATPRQRRLLAQTLAHWQQDSDLASVRDADALSALPEDERLGWQALWAEVAALEKRSAEAAEPSPADTAPTALPQQLFTP